MLAADLALRSPNDTFLLRQAASCARMCPKYISLPRFPILLGISSLPSSPPISREFCKAFSRRKLIRSSFVKPLTLRFFFSPKEIHPNRRCVWRSCAQLRFLSYFSFSSSSSPRKKKKNKQKTPNQTVVPDLQPEHHRRSFMLASPGVSHLAPHPSLRSPRRKGKFLQGQP